MKSPSNKKTAVKSAAKSRVRSTSTHPPTSKMVMAAITELKDRKGSSLLAIKKYIVSTYNVDGGKRAPYVKKYLKSAVTSGAIVHTKGRGASGCFKLPGAKTEAKPKTPKSLKKGKAEKVKASPKKAKTVADKTEKKKAAKAAIVIKPKTTKPAQAKTASKTKKTAKVPAARTKTPKPRRSRTPSRAAAKK